MHRGGYSMAIEQASDLPLTNMNDVNRLSRAIHFPVLTFLPL